LGLPLLPLLLLHLTARLVLLSLLLWGGRLLLSPLLLHLSTRLVLLRLLLRSGRLLLPALLFHLSTRLVLLRLLLSLLLGLLLTLPLPLLLHLPSRLVIGLRARILLLTRRLRLLRLTRSRLLPGRPVFAFQLFHLTPRGPVSLLCSSREFGDALSSLGVARTIGNLRLPHRGNGQAVGSLTIDDLGCSVDLQLVPLLFFGNRLDS
jgi:hypothetical protein